VALAVAAAVDSGLRDESMGRDTCHNCGKPGHWAKDCRSKAKKGEAHAAHEEESSLVMVETVQIETPTLDTYTLFPAAGDLAVLSGTGRSARARD
jgi:hypothetical protein